MVFRDDKKIIIKNNFYIVHKVLTKDCVAVVHANKAASILFYFVLATLHFNKCYDERNEISSR